MSDLIRHAENEMRLAGLYDKDADYGGLIPQAVMALVKVHAEQGHSGGSHQIVMEIFNLVANYKTLSPITDDSAEWLPDRGGVNEPMWQSNRDPSLFSTDGGKSYYSVDDDKRTIHESKHKS